ncbi:MAG: hypothetical protein HZB26_15335 [Candidatus Hydrogenedentes bacterium]|nr:hypothetical protein [Candidatus Hydrogenedentota bacterium]
MKKFMVLATVLAFALTISGLAFAADAAPAAPAAPAKPADKAADKPADKPAKAADVTLEGKVTKDGDKLVITLDKDGNDLKKGDKVTVKGGGKEGDTKVTGQLDVAKKEITVKADAKKELKKKDR